MWTTEVADTSIEWQALWATLHLANEPPPVSFDTSVVIYFAPAESSSCPYRALDAVQFDPATRRLYPVIPIDVEPDAAGAFECTADANPHAVIVAIDRADLPSEPFDVWVDNADPPACCGGGITPIRAGELRSPPPPNPLASSNTQLAVA